MGETMSQSEYNNLVKSLTDCNVALVDVNNEYRSTYDIMSDIAKQWDNMTSMEQSALATAMAGTRQQAVFFSIIEQFQEASGSMEAMANSAGALDKAYATYTESAEFHINRFKATFQELSANVMQSGMLKFFVDIGTGILNTVNAIAKLTDGIGGLAMAVAGVLSVKQNIGRDKMFSLDIVNMPIVIIVLLGYGQFRYYNCCDTTV